jgi:hypothetical protein
MGHEILLLFETSRPALGLTQPPILWVSGREVGKPSPSSARLKMSGVIPLLPYSLHGVKRERIFFLIIYPISYSATEPFRRLDNLLKYLSPLFLGRFITDTP